MKKFKKRYNQDVEIVLVPIGKTDPAILANLKNDLAEVFKKRVEIDEPLPEPDYAFNGERNQYLSTAILKELLSQKISKANSKVLGVVDQDLFVPQLNFVFGEASQQAAVISLTRLRQEFYGLPADENLFRKRVLTEAVHELGHTYGLNHCPNLHCVMFFSNTLADTDRKGFNFCPLCQKKLNLNN